MTVKEEEEEAKRGVLFPFVSDEQDNDIFFKLFVGCDVTDQHSVKWSHYQVWAACNDILPDIVLVENLEGQWITRLNIVVGDRAKFDSLNHNGLEKFSIVPFDPKLGDCQYSVYYFNKSKTRWTQIECPNAHISLYQLLCKQPWVSIQNGDGAAISSPIPTIDRSIRDMLRIKLWELYIQYICMDEDRCFDTNDSLQSLLQVDDHDKSTITNTASNGSRIAIEYKNQTSTTIRQRAKAQYKDFERSYAMFSSVMDTEIPDENPPDTSVFDFPSDDDETSKAEVSCTMPRLDFDFVTSAHYKNLLHKIKQAQHHHQSMRTEKL